MAKVKVKLLRPLNGREIGETAEYDSADAKRLAARGVVQIVKAKAAAKPANKMDPAPDNKALSGAVKKGG